MGYYSNKQIASVVEPSEIVLANNPNFVVFSSKTNTANDKRSRVEIEIKETSFTPDFSSPKLDSETIEILAKGLLSIEIQETASGIVHVFQGTYYPDKTDDKTFYVAREGEKLQTSADALTKEQALSATTYNLKTCLMKTAFLKNNFEITVLGLQPEADTIVPGHRIELVSKGSGSQYDLSISHGQMFSSDIKAVHIATVNVEGFTDNMIQYDVIGFSYKSSVTGGYVTRPSAAVFANDPSAVNGQIIVYRPQETGLSWDECNKKTLASLAGYMSESLEIKQFFEVTLDTEKRCVRLSYVEGVNKNSAYAFMLSPNLGSFISLSGENSVFITSSVESSVSSDTIDYGTGAYRLDLDVYTDHEVFPGNEDTLPYLGNYLTTLSKSYFGQPLWFDLSTLLSKKITYSSAFLSELESDGNASAVSLWSNADTMTDYRFVAKRTDGMIYEPFYYSSPLYVMNGYNSTLNPINMEMNEAGDSYILDFTQDFYSEGFTKTKPLTTNSGRTHIKGQKQYFTFIHKYRRTALPSGGDNPFPSIGLHYKLYTQSGALIQTHTERGLDASKFYRVNTALLQLDQFLPIYNGKTVGRIEVYLCRWHKSRSLNIDEPEVIISTPLSFRILPEVLNEVNDFAFLNQLGGWDTMNFGGNLSFEFKSTSGTIYKTLEPNFTLQSEIESVATKSVQEQKTVQTSPITKEDVEWLRQMSASPAVYELSTKRYIIIDDMSLKYNTTDDLYQVEMKYHYTDTFNAKI